MPTAPNYRFVKDIDGDLVRFDPILQSDVLQPGGRWSPYQLHPHADSYSADLSIERAQELAGDADLYAPAVVLAADTPIPGSGARVRAREAAAS